MNLKVFTAALVAMLSITASDAGRFPRGSVVLTPPVTNSFVALKTCGGGFIVGADVPSTGIRLIKTDVNYAYIWGSDSQWHNLITKTSMPAADFGLSPTTGTNQTYQSNDHGVLGIAGAPSDGTVAYMFFVGRVFVSTNISASSPGSITWVDTGFTQTTDGANGSWRMAGPRVAVDPHNKDHVLVATQSNGVWETTNGTHAGGATWTQISSAVLPAAQTPDSGNNSNPSYNIVFDPASGVNGSNLTNGVYIFTPSSSNPGVYRTVNGSTASLVLTTSGPTTGMQMLKASPTGGIIWAVDAPNLTDGGIQAGTVWKFTAGTGTWAATSLTSHYHSIAVSPVNANHIAALDNNSASVNVSLNGGSTWSGLLLTTTVAGGDAPWEAKAAVQLSPGDVYFDPLQGDVLLVDAGQGYWTAPLPSVSNYTYTSIVSGVEEYIGESIAVPSSNHPIIGGQDLGLFSYNSLTNSCASDPYTLAKSPVANALDRAEVAAAPGVTNLVVAKNTAGGFFVGGNDFSGKSSDGFVSNHVPYNSGYLVTVNSGTAIADNGSGLVRVNATTTGLTTWANGSGSIVCTLTFNKSVLNFINGQCFAATVIDSTHFDLQNSSYQGAISSPAVDYIFWTPTPPQSDYNGNLTITGASSNAGKIQLGLIGDGIATNGYLTCVTGVLGTTEANGCWIAEQVSGKNVTLGPSSTFTHSYTGGGIAKTVQEPGGTVAMATASNIVSVPANNGLPRCTTDGGVTWSAITSSDAPHAFTTVTSGASAGGTSITVASGAALNGSGRIQVPMDDGRLFTSLISTSGNVLTLTTPVPAGRSIASGANVYSGTGWGFASFLSYQNVDVDKVTPNTFFGVNTDAGMLKWTNCGTPILINNQTVLSGSGTWQNQGGNNVRLKTVQGEAGHLFYTAGRQGGPSGHPSGTGLWRSCNGNTNTTNGLTMQQVPGFFEPTGIGFGAPAPGHSYPAIYVVGWYDAGGVQANAVYGIWRSIDDANHGNSGAAVTCTLTNTWTKLDDWPNGWSAVPNDIQGDPSVYGEVYFASSAGNFLGMFN